jgi:ABC-type transport system substrate-binding protein
MELDRQAMVNNVFDTLAAVSIGPTLRILPTTSAELRQIPFDTLAAGRILDSLGWKRRTTDGVRIRGGKPLSFRLLVPTSSSARMRFAVLIQSQLQRAGITVMLEQVDFNAFEARQTARDFDAALGAWHSGPDPSAVAEAWTAAASKRNGGRNYSSYENPAVDLFVDSALAARGLAEEKRLYTRVYQTIIDDAPAVWLYEPKSVIGIHKRVRTAGMRPDAWWAGIGEWWIPQREKIARDRVPRAH